ncbi:MAG: PAS domain S-box protein [Asgard group archaeon]|nr:PAS domain S-box protein [Asgard group archaeon]
MTDLEKLLERDDISNDIKEIIQKTVSVQKQLVKQLNGYKNTNLTPEESNYRSIFEESPIPSMEMDLSKIKEFFIAKKVQGEEEIQDFFDKNLDESKRIVKMIHIVDVNKEFLKYYEIKDKTTFEDMLVYFWEFPFIKKALAQLLSGKTNLEEESFAYNSEGKEFHSLYKVSVVPGFEESLSKVLVSIVDISKLNAAETNLRRNEAQFRRLFEDSPIALREMDFSDVKKNIDLLKSAGIDDLEDYFENNPEEVAKFVKMVKTVNFNKATLKLFEASSLDDLLKARGKTFESNFIQAHQEHFSTLKNVILALIDGVSPIKRESVIATTKGNRITTFMTISVVPGFEQSLSKVYISNLDITKIKEAQNAILQSEKKFRSIIEKSRDGILLIDEKGIIIEWNRAITDLTGIDSEKALNKGFWEIYNPLMPGHVSTADSTNLMVERLNDILITGEADWLPRPIGTEIALPGGGHKFVQVTIFPIKTLKGHMIGSIWRDVTKQKEIETKMKQELLKFNIEEQNVYLIQEADPVLSREVIRDILRIGYSGLILSRTPEIEYRESFQTEFNYMWMAETTLEEKYSSLLHKIESVIESLPPKSVVLIERLDFLISKFGFEDIIVLIYKLREIAVFLNLAIIFSIDEETISNSQLKLIEKETRTVEPRVLAKIPLHLLEIMRFIYTRNNIGQQPSYTQIAYELNVSRPTARKRIKELTAIGYLRENQKGRTKVLELTHRGLNAFTQKKIE